MTNKTDEIKEWRAKNFETFRKNNFGDSELDKIRSAAFEKFSKTPFPTRKTEDWRFTNINPLLKERFALPNEKPDVSIGEKVNKLFFDEIDSDKVVFVNGIFNEELSDISQSGKGVFIGGLRKALSEKGDIVKKHLNNPKRNSNAFTLMNNSFFNDGFVLIVPDNVIVEKPIQVIFYTGAENENVSAFPNNLFAIGKNAQARVIVSFTGEGETYFMNANNDFHISEDAIFDIYKIQDEKRNSYHIDNSEIVQERGSVFTHISFDFGSLLTRNDLRADLIGENIETHLYGLYLTDDNRHVDNHTYVDHSAPNCESNELYKGILNDKSTGVFSGKILVKKDAQKTNAYQSNKNILLSDDARVNTKPQLEIYADDVKCSHGATVGSLDEEAFFYIRSRGIPANEAQSMLIKAFAEDVVEKVKIKETHKKINNLIFKNLNR
ncbi:MAG: Fe-S cluster assembly protein SufD [Chlorobi bacterium]|nr:Fe-S cluster assembly protein SufD [Chlorobiota bacterium]